jgi:hypothetical protein
LHNNVTQFSQVIKKIDAPNNNITDVPHLNVLQWATKPTRLKGENVAHQLNNNITMCTQSHAYPPPRSMLGMASAHYVDFNSIAQGHHFI